VCVCVCVCVCVYSLKRSAYWGAAFKFVLQTDRQTDRAADEIAETHRQTALGARRELTAKVLCFLIGSFTSLIRICT
jgi:hypothetical protein